MPRATMKRDISVTKEKTTLTSPVFWAPTKTNKGDLIN